MARKYFPIWKQLKESKKHEVAVVHPAHLHARLIKAVLKERTLDTGFALELAEADRFARVLPTSYPDKNVVVFKLKFYLDPSDI